MVIDFSSAADLTPTKFGLMMRNPVSEQEAFIEVTDQYPQMGDMHIEGRRTVTLSVEAFVELAAGAGFFPVDPNETQEDNHGYTPEA